MDTTTRFIDTLGVMTQALTDLLKRISKLEKDLQKTAATLARGDVKDRETRLEKLREAQAISEEMQHVLAFCIASPIPTLCGSLETLHTLLDESDDEMWVLLETEESLSASQTVDRLTDSITEYLQAHNKDAVPAKVAFVDNPDSFVEQFVKTHLDHKITDRMSDMVITLVTNWLQLGIL